MKRNYFILAAKWLLLIAIFAWYVVTVFLWIAYKSNGGKAPYLRYLTIKGLHIVKIK